MARHGYVDDLDDALEAGRWRGRVTSALRGKRGQAMLRELAAAMDAMPEKRLVSGSLQTRDGDCCAIGAVCKAKGLDLTQHEHDRASDLYELNESIAKSLDVAECLVQEIEFINDDWGPNGETPEQRWSRVRSWVAKKIEARFEPGCV